jgi:ABC-type glutathione transport system ATPase component
MLVFGMTPVLEIIEVSKSFRRGGMRVQAVKNASLDVQPGETVALVGESGSGKSTLGRIALCLLRPDSGRVMLAGQCLSDMPARRLQAARMVMQPVFQDPTSSFNPRRRVGDLLAQALRQKGVTDTMKQAVRLLDDVGLRGGAGLLSRYPHELSGGQRQRLAIARALALDPILIIADEPLSGADVSSRGQVLNLFADLQRSRGVAYLMITHDISVARAFAHRVAVMVGGAIVETGATETVLDSPQHLYTRSLMAAVPLLPAIGSATVSTHPQSKPLERSGPAGDRKVGTSR